VIIDGNTAALNVARLHHELPYALLPGEMAAALRLQMQQVGFHAATSRQKQCVHQCMLTAHMNVALICVMINNYTLMYLSSTEALLTYVIEQHVKQLLSEILLLQLLLLHHISKRASICAAGNPSYVLM
jgi:hypothetical protein